MRVGGRSLLPITHMEMFTGRGSGTIQIGDSSSRKTHLRLTKKEIVKMRARAIRRGSWFKVLTKAERAYIELTIRVVNGVRSHFLAKVLTSIIRKLVNVLESKVVHIARRVGQHLAQKISRIAWSWGNISAINWKKDPRFIRYLSIMHINTTGTSVV